MKLVSWNVNGIRAAVKKGFTVFVAQEDPDIVCIQETKATPEQVFLPLDAYPFKYWNSSKAKKGYSGTAIFAKHNPISVFSDIGIEEHDQEGRVLTLEYESYYLVNVYTPNSQRGLTRLQYRTEWDRCFRKFIKTLQESKPVIVCGDLNVAHKSIDLSNPKSNMRNAGFTIEERMGFSQLLDIGLIDTFRHFYPNAEKRYSWWSYMGGARERNIGWRIDYFCVSESIRDKCKDAAILDQVYGSDHCPVSLSIDP